MDIQKKYKIALIGATGACGKEIVKFAMASDDVEVLSVLTRRVLPEWK